MTVQPFTTRSLDYILMMFSAFLCYLALVMPLSSLSVFVTRDWGMSNAVAGLAAGAAFFVTILFRKPAGDRVDAFGGKHCFLRGTLWYTVAGCVCLVAAHEGLPLEARLAFLLGGRALLGVGECLCNVSMACWAVDLLGVEKSGRIFATLGMSMYAAAAVGGQAGFYLFSQYGYFGLVLVCTLSPLAAFFISRGRPDVFRKPTVQANSSIFHIFRLIRRVGLASMCCAVGFAVVGAFLSKTFIDRGWEYAGLAFSACGAGFVAMRPCLGHLPDKIGGMPVAALSGSVEVAGVYLLWMAEGPYTALLGSFLTGAGVSMVFPANGSEIAKTVSTEIRGTSLSCYNIFTDIAYGFSAPVAGFFTDRWGDGAAYLFAALCATAGLAIMLNNLWLDHRGRAVVDK